MGCLDRATCSVSSISAQTSQEGIKCTTAKEQTFSVQVQRFVCEQVWEIFEKCVCVCVCVHVTFFKVRTFVHVCTFWNYKNLVISSILSNKNFKECNFFLFFFEKMCSGARAGAKNGMQVRGVIRNLILWVLSVIRFSFSIHNFFLLY